MHIPTLIFLAFLFLFILLGFRGNSEMVDTVNERDTGTSLKNQLRKATSSSKTKEERIREIALKNGYNNSEINKALSIASGVKPSAKIKFLAKMIKNPDDVFDFARSIPVAKINQLLGSKSSNVA